MADRVDISEYLEKILTAVYGEEVRGSIHDSIEALHQEVERGVITVTDTFNDRTAAGVAADAKAIHEQALLIRGKLSSGTEGVSVNLNDMNTSGVYRLITSETYINSPLGTNTGWLVVYHYGDGGRNCMQIAYETGTAVNTTYNTYFRTYSASNGWGPWQASIYSIDDTLTKAGEAADAKAVGDRFDRLEYAPIEFTQLVYAFQTQDGVAINGGELAEKGTTIVNMTYEWTVNKEPTSVTLDGGKLTIDTSHPTWNQGVLNLPTGLTTNKTWTFKAKEKQTGSIPVVTTSMAATVKFASRIFWGAKPNTGEPNSTFIESLRSTSVLSETLDTEFTVTAGTGDYIWFAYPKRFGRADFSYGGFTGGFFLFIEEIFTNKYGASEPYYVYRSDNPSLGNTKITVTKRS